MKIKKLFTYRAYFGRGADRKCFLIVADGAPEALGIALSAGAGAPFESINFDGDEVYLATE